MTYEMQNGLNCINPNLVILILFFLKKMLFSLWINTS